MLYPPKTCLAYYYQQHIILQLNIFFSIILYFKGIQERRLFIPKGKTFQKNCMKRIYYTAKFHVISYSVYVIDSYFFCVLIVNLVQVFLFFKKIVYLRRQNRNMKKAISENLYNVIYLNWKKSFQFFSLFSYRNELNENPSSLYFNIIITVFVGFLFIYFLIALWGNRQIWYVIFIALRHFLWSS